MPIRTHERRALRAAGTNIGDAWDDIARLDWRVYGRTRRLFVRQFEEEKGMAVHVLVNTSASMR